LFCVRIPRRILARVALYLILGFATTIAIAWFSALLAPLRGLSYANPTCLNDFIGNGFSIIEWHLPCTDRVAWFGRPSASPNPAAGELPTFAFSRRFPHWWGRPIQVETDTITSDIQHVQDARGWPIVALWCEWPSAQDRVGPIRGGLALPSAPQRDLSAGDPPDVFAVRGLPLRPIWIGLVADTLILGFAWFALFTSPHSIRFALRTIRAMAATTRSLYRRRILRRSIVWVALLLSISLIASAVFARSYYLQLSLDIRGDSYGMQLTGRGAQVWYFSYGRRWAWERWQLSCSSGAIYYGDFGDFSLWPTWGPYPLAGAFVPPVAKQGTIPIWCLILPVAAATAVLFHRSRRAARIARISKPCPRCSYSLLNLPPNSPCPECGHTPHTPPP
jgi:hypothetical protein